MRNKIAKYSHEKFIKSFYPLINGFTFKCILPIKVFYSTLKRTLVIPNRPKMWWRKRDSKVDAITSTAGWSSFPILLLVSLRNTSIHKEYHFEHFLLRSLVIIEIAGLRQLMLFIRMSRESHKDWNCSQFWLGDLYNHLRKHRLFVTVISVTKHFFRLDISYLRIMGKCPQLGKVFK